MPHTREMIDRLKSDLFNFDFSLDGHRALPNNEKNPENSNKNDENLNKKSDNVGKREENSTRSNIYYPIRQFKKIGKIVEKILGKFLLRFDFKGFKVTNITDRKLPVHIRVQPFQDYENGQKILNLGGKFAWVGCLETILPEVLYQF